MNIFIFEYEKITIVHKRGTFTSTSYRRRGALFNDKCLISVERFAS